MRNFNFDYKRISGRIALVVVLLTSLSATNTLGRGVTQGQLSRLDPRTEATSVLLETVKELLKDDQLEEALPFLDEILIRLEGDEEKKARQTMAFTLYQLGHCQMKLADFAPGAKNFIRFADTFPDDPQNAEARVLAAQCLTMLQQWPQVEEQSALVLADRRLSSDLKIPATQLLAESRYQQEKWTRAVSPLATLFRSAKKDTVRSGAAVMLVTCYVRMNDFENLFKFLPYCDEGSRHDVGLNVALLEAGDGHYNKGEYQKALLLYRLVLLKADLIPHYENRMREIKEGTLPFAAGGSVSLTDYKETLRKKQLLYDRMAKHLQIIRDFQDYDMDVALRIAQCYGDLERNWPAYAIYQRIYTENPTNSLAEQARFSAFSVMLDEREWAMAIAEGYEYVNLLPQGEFVDDVTLNLMQVHMQQEQFSLAFDIGQRGLELSPDHKYIDQIKYIMGYVRFIQFDYTEALGFFSDVLKRWPDSRYYESAEYWRSMTLLFLGNFEEAVMAFKGYLTNPKYEIRRYDEDASYRLGIAQYGAELDAESEATFKAFVDKYPESTLLSEAYAMLGDLRGNAGDLTVALDFYRLAREKALNMSQVNYPVFQSAKVLELEKRYAEIVELMGDYLTEWGEKSDLANAVNWQGVAFKALDEYPHALDAYFAAADEYGNNAALNGVDLILSELISDYKGEEWAAYSSIASSKLGVALHQAGVDNKKTLELRYQTVFANVTKGDERAGYIDQIMQPKNIPSSGSLTLVLIAREGVIRKDYEIVHEAFRRYMSNFDVSANMLYVMNANLDALVIEGEYEDALALSEEILMKFGYSSSVGWARKRRGDVYRLQGKHELAIEAYNELLAIREWRGPLTPEALFCIGNSKLELGETEEAFAYFQRIYVLYEQYTEWVAPAYARSIECLTRLGDRSQDVINTYEEMLANEQVALTPEGREAQIQLNKLKPAGEAL